LTEGLRELFPGLMVTLSLEEDEELPDHWLIDICDIDSLSLCVEDSVITIDRLMYHQHDLGEIGGDEDASEWSTTSSTSSMSTGLQPLPVRLTGIYDSINSETPRKSLQTFFQLAAQLCLTGTDRRDVKICETVVEDVEWFLKQVSPLQNVLPM
jgi:hypothetical protein